MTSIRHIPAARAATAYVAQPAAAACVHVASCPSHAEPLRRTSVTAAALSGGTCTYAPGATQSHSVLAWLQPVAAKNAVAARRRFILGRPRHLRTTSSP